MSGTSAPKVRKLLIKTRKLWTERHTQPTKFYSGIVLCEETKTDAEDFCFEWVKMSRSKRRRKNKQSSS